MYSRFVPACANSCSLAATPPAWSTTSPDQTCTRSSLKPMRAALAFLCTGLAGCPISLTRLGNETCRPDYTLGERAAKREPRQFRETVAATIPGGCANELG